MTLFIAVVARKNEHIEKEIPFILRGITNTHVSVIVNESIHNVHVNSGCLASFQEQEE